MPTSSAGPTDTTVLSGFTDVTLPEQGKLRFDLYKLRAEEYLGRYESMRVLEWKILFQMYGGYAAIALAYDHLQTKNSDNQILLACFAIFATLAFYSAARYLTFRIQERLISFDNARRAYLKQMHALLQTSEIPMKPLGHRFHWSYHTQLLLSTLTCFCLVSYASTRGLPITVSAVVAGIAGVALLACLPIKWAMPVD
jgi:hypothetical protein